VDEHGVQKRDNCFSAALSGFAKPQSLQTTNAFVIQKTVISRIHWILNANIIAESSDASKTEFRVLRN
jgi:hypothetical protein